MMIGGADMHMMTEAVDRVLAKLVWQFMPDDFDRTRPGDYWPLRLIWATRFLWQPDLLTSFIVQSSARTLSWQVMEACTKAR